MASALWQENIGKLSYGVLQIQGSIPLCLMVWGVILGERTGALIIVLAVVVNWGCYAVGGRLLRLPVAEDTAIQETIRLSQAAGVTTPAVYEVKSNNLGASAIYTPRWRSVLILTSETLHLPINELRAVIAHELSHISNRDSLVNTVLWTVVGLTVGSTILLNLELWWLPFALLFLPAVSWAIECRADCEGANICGNPLALAEALNNMKSKGFLIRLLLWFYPVLTMFLVLVYQGVAIGPVPPISVLLLLALTGAYVFPSHPPVFLRVWRLRKLAARLA